MTRLLQPSLAGNSRTAVLCTVSVAASNFNETVNSLRFGQRAKKVVNAVKQNVIKDNKAKISELLQHIKTLKHKLSQAPNGRALSPSEEVKAQLTSAERAKSAAEDKARGHESRVKELEDTSRKQASEYEERITKIMGLLVSKAHGGDVSKGNDRTSKPGKRISLRDSNFGRAWSSDRDLRQSGRNRGSSMQDMVDSMKMERVRHMASLDQQATDAAMDKARGEEGGGRRLAAADGVCRQRRATHWWL